MDKLGERAKGFMIRGLMLSLMTMVVAGGLAE